MSTKRPRRSSSRKLMAGTSTDRDNDFGLLDLPTHILTEVLSYLSLKDLYSASLVCRQLRDLFGHPLVWQRLTVVIRLTAQRYRERVRKWVTRNQRAMWPGLMALRNKLQHVRHLTFVLEAESGVRAIHPMLRAPLSGAMILLGRHSSRLTGLTLRARLPPHMSTAPVLSSLFAIFSSGPRLCTLRDNVLCRPPDVVNAEAQGVYQVWNVFRLLLQPSLSTSLTSLELWGEEAVMSLGGHQVALRVLMTQAMTSLTALRMLSVWHLLLDWEVLGCLSKTHRPSKLRMLLVHFLHVHTAPNTKPPLCEVGEEGWDELRSANPDLSLELLSHPGFPMTWLVDVIPRRLAVTHLRVASWSEELTSRLTRVGQLALRELHLQASDVTLGESVLTVVASSRELRDVRLAGSISPCDVRHLAEIRGTRWRTLDIYAPLVITDNPTPPTPLAVEDTSSQSQSSQSDLPSPEATSSCLPSTSQPESDLPCTSSSCARNEPLTKPPSPGEDEEKLQGVASANAASLISSRDEELARLERDVSGILGFEWHLSTDACWWH